MTELILFAILCVIYPPALPIAVVLLVTWFGWVWVRTGLEQRAIDAEMAEMARPYISTPHRASKPTTGAKHYAWGLFTLVMLITLASLV